MIVIASESFSPPTGGSSSLSVAWPAVVSIARFCGGERGYSRRAAWLVGESHKLARQSLVQIQPLRLNRNQLTVRTAQ